MLKAIGMVELTSIAKGFEAADAMLKTAAVELLASTPVCPGKYFIIVHGDVSAVESAVNAGKSICGELLVDEFVLANVHPMIFPAITATSTLAPLKALGILEAFSVSAMIVSADAALKAADVDAIELRLGSGLGGKSYFTMTGDVAAVNAATEAGSKILKEKGMMVEKVVIPSPAKELLSVLI